MNIKTKTTKIYVIISMISILAVLTGTVVYAYFTDSVMHQGAIAFTFDDTKPELVITQNINKINATVRNRKDVNVNVRFYVMAEPGVTIQGHSSNVSDVDGGYYYYNSILEAGQTTDTVTFNCSIDPNASNIDCVVVAETFDADYTLKK